MSAKSIAEPAAVNPHVLTPSDTQLFLMRALHYPALANVVTVVVVIVVVKPGGGTTGTGTGFTILTSGRVVVVGVTTVVGCTVTVLIVVF